MRLTHIALRNIGPFCGDHILDLSMPSVHNGAFHLVGGRNGSGKTTILEALYVLWYGNRSPYVRQAKGGWSEYRTNLIHNKSTGSASISVELEAALGRDQASLRVELTWDRHTASRTPMYLVRRDGVPDALFSRRWPVLAEELLPQALAPLFWSDGEHLADALETRVLDASFSNAVRTVLGLNITDPLINALDQITTKVLEEDGYRSPAQGLIQYEQEIKSLDVRRRVVTQEMASERTRLRYVFKDTQPGNQDVPVDSCSEAIDAWARLRDLARGPLALLPLVPLLERAHPWIQALVEHHGAGPPITPILFDERDLQLVLTFLRKFGPGIASDAQATLHQVALSGAVAHFPLQMTPDGSRVEMTPRSQERSLARLEAELETLNHQLGRMHQARQRLIKSSTRSQHDQGLRERKLKSAIRVKGIFQTFAAQITLQRLQALESHLNDALRLFAHKGHNLGRLRVDPEEGQILLVTGDGEPVPSQHLSAGEQQLLLLAMMWGLRQSSGFSVPLIMDTLLARLDLDHRERLFRTLQQPDANQVILFATDGEVAGQQVHGLSPSILHMIDHSIDTKESQIHRGRYFDHEEAPGCFQTKSS